MVSTYVFIQKLWHAMKEGIVELFKELYESGSFIKPLNSFFLVIIVEVEGTDNIKNFRSNSSVGSIYKLIAKVLVRRMTKIMDKVVGEC